MTRKKILIVDDNPVERQLIVDALADSGYYLITAIDGHDALAKVVSEQPDLIVLDIILPRKNGFQVCRQIKTTPDISDIKIIMLSSKKYDSDRFWGLKQGADDYMVKPLDSESLRINIARHLQ